MTVSGIDFAGKAALVTGAAMGIGRATAIAFARAGAKVAISDLNDSAGRETEAMIRDAGGDAFYVHCDVAKDIDVAAMVKETVSRFGRLDFACNNAGVSGPLRRIEDWTEAEFDLVTDASLRGTWLCMKHEIKQMRRQGSGAIVNLSSAAGLVGMRGMSVYCSAKHGVIGLTKSAALELAPAGIRVNALCPGGIETALAKFDEATPEAMEAFKVMTPIGRTAKPSEVADLILFLCSDQASYITGHAMPIDGGRMAQAGPYPPTPEGLN
jgi:NAD(P)-dependent dehydrogenase (short-subunit alcohol dehydrogenase family)